MPSIRTAGTIEDFHVEIFQRPPHRGQCPNADLGMDQRLDERRGIRRMREPDMAG